MNKKQILSTVLAGLITLNTLGGCANSNKISNSVNTEIIATDDYKKSLPKYDISFCDLNYATNEEGSIIKGLEDGIIVGDKIYSVSKLDSSKTRYERVVDQNKATEIVNDYINAIQTGLEEKEMDSYKITIMNLSNFYNEEGELLYQFPVGVIKNDKVYKVEELVTKTETYPALVETLEDGTVKYSAPYGGTVEGNIVSIETSSYKLLTAYNARVIIENYLNQNSLKLEK